MPLQSVGFLVQNILREIVMLKYFKISFTQFEILKNEFLFKYVSLLLS